MDRFLATIFRYIPESIFVLIILVGGLYYFMFEKPIYSVCNAQINDYVKGQNGKFFPKGIRVLNPKTGGTYSENTLKVARQKCISSIRGFGCNEYFLIMASAIQDIAKLDPKCRIELSQNSYFSSSINQYMSTMAQLAWGEIPPATQFDKTSWLDQSTLKTFCRTREYYRQFYDDLRWNGLVGETLNMLTEDPTKPSRVQTKLAKIDEKAKEKEGNAEDSIYYFPKAKITTEKAFDLSLFSLDCLHYL